MAPRKYSLGMRAQSVEETRRRIVDATFELHSEKGVVATSMQDVAERADVASRTVYNHFPTIDDLVQGCGYKVMALMAPPTPAVFDGATTVWERLRKLVSELFAMYERVAPLLAVARFEQHRVPALAAFLANDASTRRALVAEALRPFAARRTVVQEVMALTDFYVWKAFADQDLTTRQAVEIISRTVAAIVDPGERWEEGSTSMTSDAGVHRGERKR